MAGLSHHLSEAELSKATKTMKPGRFQNHENFSPLYEISLTIQFGDRVVSICWSGPSRLESPEEVPLTILDLS